MSDRGRERDGPKGPTRSSGLGAPLNSDVIPESVVCPFCDGIETEQFSAFGSALSVSQYWCRNCRTVFEWMKWRERASSP
jgi:hypothetical protein